MTPAQLDHLSRIKRHLETLLANAEKRTPGEWLAGATIVGNGVDTTVCEMPFQSKNSDWTSNMVFIASCAGNAEAGWTYTLKRLTRFLDAYNLGIEKDCKVLCVFAEVELLEILAAWPIENLP